MAEEAEAEEMKWVKHYSSMQEILIVGDGDFSFALSLANAFGSATNIVATSLDSHDVLLKKYSKAKQNLESLENMGAIIMHGIDVTRLKLYADLKMRKFDRIVFNFPHAGFKGKEDQIRLINLHRKLVSGFFRNARHMLRPHGEIDISHKIGGPFQKWNLEELASNNSLVLVERVKFRIEDYPGYHNKRGDGPKCDQPFPLGECCTYKFRIGHIQKKKPSSNPVSVCGSSFNATPGVGIGSGNSDGHSHSLVYPRGDYSLQEARPVTQFLIDVQGTPGSGPMMTVNMCNGNSGTEVISPVLDHLMYLEDLHRESIIRQAELRKMLFRLDQEEGRGPM